MERGVREPLLRTLSAYRWRLAVLASGQLFFFFTATATPELHTLSLHDALPISFPTLFAELARRGWSDADLGKLASGNVRSEEHTSELQSRGHLVCRLLLEKKNRAPLRTCWTKSAFSPSAASAPQAGTAAHRNST